MLKMVMLTIEVTNEMFWFFLFPYKYYYYKQYTIKKSSVLMFMQEKKLKEKG